MRFSLKTLIWLTIFVALLLAIGLAMFPQPVEVEFATVMEGPLRVSVQEDGKTRIREKFIVSAPVAGRLSRIELDPGDPCDDQTLLAVILPANPEILDARAQAEATARVQAGEAALQRAESTREQAKIENELAQSKYARYQRLLPANAVTRDEFETARTEALVRSQAIKTAEFGVEIARFELEMAQASLAQFKEQNPLAALQPFEIHAPVEGKILRVFQESSTVVSVGAELMEIGDPRELEIEIDVLSTDAVRMKPGAEVTIEHWGGGEPLRALVRVVEPAAFTKISSLGVEEQRVNIIADFDEPAERLASLGDGYRVEGRITIAELPNALQIPNSALFRYQRLWHVLKIVDERAELHPVEIGLQNESHTEIIEGLAAGDRVIVYPSDTLSPGARVRLAPGG